MRKPDLFDEIIECLEREAEFSKFTNISAETMGDLFSDAEKISSGDASSMDELRTEVSSCRKCALFEGRTRTVFGAGNENADLMFIGEGPGRDEDEQGLPFVGRAGQLLTRMINAMQYDRSEVYIANIVKCRPPNNRNPEENEMEADSESIDSDVEVNENVSQMASKIADMISDINQE